MSQKEKAISVIKQATVLVLALTSLYCGWVYGGGYEIKFDITLWLGAIGSLLAFIGNGFVTSAVTGYDARKSMLWKVGNPLQAAGFLMTLLALILGNS